MKMCLIVGGIIGGLGLVVIIGCGVGVWFIGCIVVEMVEMVLCGIEEIKELIVFFEFFQDVNEVIVYFNNSDIWYYKVGVEYFVVKLLDLVY